jgi:hypothetical protein
MDCLRRSQWWLGNLNKRAVYHSDEKMHFVLRDGDRGDVLRRRLIVLIAATLFTTGFFSFFFLTATMRVYTSRRNFE